jgi:dodecin
MSDSVYKVIEIVGTSAKSWEAAAATTVERASQTLRDLRVAEVASRTCKSRTAKLNFTGRS